MVSKDICRSRLVMDSVCECYSGAAPSQWDEELQVPQVADGAPPVAHTGSLQSVPLLCQERVAEGEWSRQQGADASSLSLVRDWLGQPGQDSGSRHRRLVRFWECRTSAGCHEDKSMCGVARGRVGWLSDNIMLHMGFGCSRGWPLAAEEWECLVGSTPAAPSPSVGVWQVYNLLCQGY